MICTSSYDNWKTDYYVTYSISFDKGKDANYNGKCYLDLAPKQNFWRIWKNQIGRISEEENNRYYVNEYWLQVLSKLDPEKVYKDLNYSTLLCYEDNTKFCHRHIVAAWLEILLGIKVPEMKIKDCVLEEVDKPIYIKKYLEDSMKLNRNMRGFTSLRALYLFEKSEELEQSANILEEQTSKCYDDYRQKACFLRCDADMIEEEYKIEQKQKILSKIK